MKKVLMVVIFILWGLNVGMPWLYYRIFGYFQVYSSISPCPNEYMDRAALMISVEIIVIFCGLYFFKMKDEARTETRKDISIVFWYVCLIIQLMIKIFPVILSKYDIGVGGFINIIVSYISLFTDLSVLYVFYLFSVKKNHLLILSISYLLFTVVCASRSGALHILILLLLREISLVRKFSLSRKKIGIAIALVILLPSIFMFSTNYRLNFDKENSGYITLENMTGWIIGRCSNLELSGIALYQWDKGIYEERLFEEKYGLENQAGLIMNATVPGDFGKADVNPNQYYRAIFGLPSVEHCANVYTSLNMGLPIYFSLKYGYVIGMLLACLIPLTICFLLSSKNRMNYFYVYVAYYVMNGILFPFDWVQLFRVIQPLLCTSLTIMIYKYIENRVVAKRKECNGI